ncbi:unnamed protein product [Fasciola hepatica]|uniref:Uncharacterized protein n=1 Tax=Fasciola hepatica TaxID=6192 RepID=A0ABC9HJ71_FASHE
MKPAVILWGIVCFISFSRTENASDFKVFQGNVLGAVIRRDATIFRQGFQYSKTKVFANLEERETLEVECPSSDNRQEITIPCRSEYKNTTTIPIYSTEVTQPTTAESKQFVQALKLPRPTSWSRTHVQPLEHSTL